MKRTKLDLSPERKIIINLITSDEFCKQVIPVLRPYYFASSYGRLISEWVIEYFDKYSVSPGPSIQDIYLEKRGSLRKEEDIDNLSDFLESISNEYASSKPNNVEFAVDEAIKYLKIRSLTLLKDAIEDSLNSNDPLNGEKIISEFGRVEKPSGEGVSIIKDAKEVLAAFNDEEELLFRFPGALGQVVGDLHRGDFFTFIAPMKRGKTWWLWYTSEVAMWSGCKVVFFTLEMTEKQMIRRAWRSLVAQPKERGEVTIPYFEKDDNGKYEILEKKEEKRGLNPMNIEKTQKKLKRMIRKGDSRIIQLPGYQATVSIIEAHLNNLNFYDNYVPDVIVVDYADLLAPSKKAGSEYRHQLDDIWKGLRRIAQVRNVLMVTASQSAKETFGRDIKEGDIAEDIRKIAHCTSALGLNQRKDEKEKGIMRVSQLAIREGRQVIDQALILQCLDIGKPCLDSKFLRECIVNEK